MMMTDPMVFASDLDDNMPSVPRTASDDLDTSALLYALVNAVQTLKAEIDDLRAHVSPGGA